MQLHQHIKLKELGILNPLIEDYLSQKPSLDRLYTHKAELSSIQAAIEGKQHFAHRKVLVQALNNQYANFKLSPAVKSNLDLLEKENTFTICTAHQLCLFTGPSYFIYKILSAIKLSRDLKAEFPEQNFIPVYWMGSEDHDFEEISTAHIYGKSVVWENPESGAVGERSLAGIEESIAQVSEILGDNDKANTFIAQLKQFFSGDQSYGQAFQSWVLELFQDFGLLVLDQNDALLKSTFIAPMEDELLNHSVQQALRPNEKFLDEEYHVQASSRTINLFYLKDQIRERIEQENQGFNVVNTSIKFTKEEIQAELKTHPERFSPNVFLRPVYQESILPNVAFVGGPGEVAYWLQLKDVFNHFQVPQPLILLRDMAVVMNGNHLDKLKDWEIEVADLFTHYDEIAKRFVAQESDNELNLDEEKLAIKKVFDVIKTKAIPIDQNMERSVDAEQQKVFNSLSNLESKLMRAEKRNYEQQLNQLENIQSKLLPNNTLQERYDNFIPLYLNKQEDYFQRLLETFNAFDQTLKVFKT